MMLGIAVVAEPLILTLFGVGWAAAIPLLRILALSGVLWPLHVLNLSVLKAMGHSGKFFRVEVIKKAVGVSLLIVGAWYGIQGMAWAVVVSSVSSYILNAYYNGKLLEYGVWKQCCDLAPCFILAALMAVLVIACSHVVHFSPLPNLVILSATGAFSYLVISKIFRIQELDEILRFIRSTIKRSS
jgi:teichuronic acid exporter